MPQTEPLPAPGAAATTRRPRYSLDICHPGHRARTELEDFVRQAFQRAHGARVATFMPTLVALRDRTGGLCGVVGYRAAAQDRLYLEHYLDAPVERAISATAGRDVPRETVVEVGNLAAVNCRSARHLAAMLPGVLLAERYAWLVFTGTRVVRSILQGFGAPLLDLAPAAHERPVGTDDDWGTYYDAEPRVMAGFLPHARVLAPFARGLDH